MEKQIGQLAQAVTHLAQKNANSLPAQPEVNPQVRNVSAITLRSGKHLGEGPLAEKDEITEEEFSEPNARPLIETRARALATSLPPLPDAEWTNIIEQAIGLRKEVDKLSELPLDTMEPIFTDLTR